jgi:hypothetical protein
MKLGLIHFLLFICIGINAQKIECRNDSLFINQYYINKSTPRYVFDSLLNSKASIKSVTGKTVSATKRRATITRFIYKKIGIQITNSDADSAGLTIGIKLQRNSNNEVDFNNMSTEVFKGQLYVGGNYNDKKTIEQLQQLPNCTLDSKRTSFNMQGTPVSLILGRLSYLSKTYQLYFDSKTAELTCIFIH